MGECTASGPSKLTLVTRDPDTEDRAKWSWKSLPQTPDTEFEDPLSTDYAFCAYGSDYPDYGPFQTISMAEMPAGSGWTSTPSGFKYKDSALSAVLRTDKAGRTKIKVRGEGPVINLPAAFSDYPDVRVRVRTLNQCWEGFHPSYYLKIEPDRIRGK